MVSSIRQRTKHLIYAGVTGVLVSSLLFASLGLYGYQQLGKQQDVIVEQYEAKLREAEEFKREQMKQKAKVLLASQDIKAGETLTAEMFTVGELPAENVPDNIISDVNEVVGKVTKIEISKNGTVIPTMLYEEGRTPRDMRAAEYTIISLPSKLQKDDYIDVRINFPTGQDYTVLGKKRVQDLAAGTVWLDVNEQEILTMSSATVDAYLNDGKIYALVYKDPQMQDAPVVNYPVNLKVLDLMLENPNLIRNAKQTLSRNARTLLENDIKEMSAEERQKVTTGRAAEVSPITSGVDGSDAASESASTTQHSQPLLSPNGITPGTSQQQPSTGTSQSGSTPAGNTTVPLPPADAAPATSESSTTTQQKEEAIYQESIDGAIQP